jgi:hypothetical protein
MFVTLLMLGTAIIGSGHVVLARDLSNSGNYLVNDQNCTAGNSCNLSSSNTVTSGSSGLTSPSPSTPTPTPTTLTLSVGPPQPPSQEGELQGTLDSATGPVVGATITFTSQFPGSESMPITTPVPVVTDTRGNYGVAVQDLAEFIGSIITAHYSGAPAMTINALAASSVSEQT